MRTLPAPAATNGTVNPLRRALGQMATSVTLVTTRIDGADYGFTANSFTSVSAEPPLVTVFIANTAACYQAFATADHIAVNVLADGQGDLAMLFATKGADKFAHVALDQNHSHVPVVQDAMASIIGRVELSQPAGDHLMLLIAVDHVEYSGQQPLVYHNREFRKLV